MVAITALSLVSACVQKSDTYTTLATPPPPAASPTAPIEPTLSTQADTINLEASDRIARFIRLAGVSGITPPVVDQLYAPAGTVPGVNMPVPVVRVVFQERVLFDFDQSVPRAEATPVIEMIAANMKRDVPDAALTILGHTDAVGSDAYNLGLSQRRATAVLGRLVALGTNANQLSTVAIGKAQPIASNLNEEGRARNRRVEFLISGSEQANLSVLQNRSINLDYLKVAVGAPTPMAPKTVEVLKLRQSPTEDGVVELGPAGLLTLREPDPPVTVVPTPLPPPVAPRTVTRKPPIVPREPEEVLPAPLREPAPLNF